MALLIINRSDSECGACGQPATWSEDAHITRLGYNPGEGCGAVWDAVSSNYFGMDEAVQRCRPDLPFISPVERLNI